MSISKTGCSSSITKADLESSYKQGFADCAKILADDYNQTLSDLWKLVTSKHDEVMDLQDLSECEVIKVTLAEIENAIESLIVIKDISMKTSKVNSLMCRVTKEVAAAMDETMSIALKSMMFLYGIMKQNNYDEVSTIKTKNSVGKTSGSVKQNCMGNKFCGRCIYYQAEKDTYTCMNARSERFNTNPAPFQRCSCFSDKGK